MCPVMVRGRLISHPKEKHCWSSVARIKSQNQSTAPRRKNLSLLRKVKFLDLKPAKGSLPLPQAPFPQRWVCTCWHLPATVQVWVITSLRMGNPPCLTHPDGQPTLADLLFNCLWQMESFLNLQLLVMSVFLQFLKAIVFLLLCTFLPS